MKLCAMLCGSLDGRGIWGRMDARLCMAELLHCSPETITALLISYKWNLLIHVRLFAAPWTLSCQAPLSMEFSRQKYWRCLPFPSPGNLPNQGIEPRYAALQVDSLSSELPGKPIHLLYSNTNKKFN